MTRHGNTKHGMFGTRIYTAWVNIIGRCYNKNKEQYPNYGGRGISVCEEWRRSFENFYKDMGASYEDGLQIDRIDVNGNYHKENCRWVSNGEQKRNTRRNILITYNNRTMVLQDWADELGLNKETLRSRIKKWKWPIEKALFTSTVTKYKL